MVHFSNCRSDFTNRIDLKRVIIMPYQNKSYLSISKNSYALKTDSILLYGKIPSIKRAKITLLFTGVWKNVNFVGSGSYILIGNFYIKKLCIRDMGIAKFYLG